MFPDAVVKHLPRLDKSDHCPLLLDTDGFPPPPSQIKPFRFESAWLLDPRFKEFLKTEWEKVRAKYMTDLGTWQLVSLNGIWRLLEEILWFQKAMTKWIQSRDRNTRYFHTLALVRRSKNKVRALRDESGAWITDQQELKHMAVNHYKNLYSKTLEESRTPISQLLSKLEDYEVIDLHRLVNEEEIKEAMFDIGAFKAPGPDGYQDHFFHKNWEIVRSSVIRQVQEAFVTGTFPEDLNKTLITLIPKVKHLETINQLRLISLCNVAYKVISKIIVSILEPLLPKLIAPTQNSFVPGRLIVDNIIIVQEMFHTFRKKKGKAGAIAWKIDLEKVYGKMNWEFMREILLEIGFNRPISYVFFADDLVLSLDASIKQVDTMVETFKEFNLWFGQSVSLAKSKIYVSKNVRKSEAMELSRRAEIPLTKDLGKYLGVPLIHSRVTKKTYWSIVEKVQEKFANWKINTLSLTSRTVLIKAAAAPVPVYTMQTSKLPTAVCDEIDKYCRTFLWGSTAEKGRCNKLIWSKSSNGDFTTSSAYHTIVDRGGEQQTIAKEIWKIKCQPKIQNFLWLAWKNKIMNNANRMARGLTNDACCKMCGATIESMIHILRDCHVAKDVWLQLLGVGVNSLFFTCPEEEWWKLNLVQQRKKMFGCWPWLTMFSITYWKLWKWRNDFRLSNISTSINTKMVLINKAIQETLELSTQSGSTKAKVEVQLSWDKPLEGWTKLNTDGSRNQTSDNVAIGGVIRGHCGEWVIGFSQAIGKCSIDMAELWAIQQGISLAWNRGIRELEVESNSATSISMIKNGVSLNHPLFCVVEAIREMITKDWNCRINYVPRQKNFVADWLAKNNRELWEGLLLFHIPLLALSTC
ncbi:reverse transcriptase [Corchorus capsularis]|uniref:Reverse transcriptase n=1 Tax=Corchorus capsularis TaxID=210143 RepID=A0A1R3K7V1_COCAP|nr:reverse transcriptase [Corchorus capsularis]